jgi:hypothetical protein
MTVAWTCEQMAARAARELSDGGYVNLADKPGDLLDLRNWFLTLPVGTAGDPDSIDQPELLDYRSEWFDLTPDRTGVVFRAPAGA